MGSGAAFVLHCAILLIAISCTSADFSKSKAKSKFYEQTIKDLTRKSIVFDKHTPDVFYCIPSKPAGDEKVIVQARPIHKLCEYEGVLPKSFKSDCYKDVDESDYACKEKYRIMMRMYPPGSDAPYNGTKLVKFMKTTDQKPLTTTQTTDQKATTTTQTTTSTKTTDTKIARQQSETKKPTTTTEMKRSRTATERKRSTNTKASTNIKQKS